MNKSAGLATHIAVEDTGKGLTQALLDCGGVGQPFAVSVTLRGVAWPG